MTTAISTSLQYQHESPCVEMRSPQRGFRSKILFSFVVLILLWPQLHLLWFGDFVVLNTQKQLTELPLQQLPTRHSLRNTVYDETQDWFDMKAWTSNPVTNSCYAFEDVCISAHSWYYNKPSGGGFPNQPNLAIDMRYEMQTDMNVTKKFRTVPVGYPSQIRVENRPAKLKWKESSSQSHCPYSPIKNHMIVHGYFNHMLGEFYERCFMGLVDIFLTSIRLSNITWDALSTQSQLYLHLNTGDVSSLLTSHKMLMGALSTNPLHRLEDLLDGTQCRCLKRLILCGYQTLAESTDHELILRPARHVGIQQHYFVDRSKKASPQYAAVRRFLRQRLVVGNPSMKENLVPANRQRIIRQALLQANLTVPEVIDHRKWKVIGFSQRTIRRKWTNLDEVLNYCLKYVQHNVACWEINLEIPDFDSVSQHIQAHASVDALIGIHGASLTEAVLMPPGSTVVELLPWLYDSSMYGSWTTWVHRPTPLGVLFSDTDLVHVGIPLPRNSSKDHCAAAVNKKKCFGQESYRWDNRPFLLDPWFLFEKVVKNIILHEGDSCDGWVQSAGDDSVLYNIPCVHNNQPKIGHYYRSAQWLEEKRKGVGGLSTKQGASSSQMTRI